MHPQSKNFLPLAHPSNMHKPYRQLLVFLLQVPGANVTKPRWLFCKHRCTFKIAQDSLNLLVHQVPCSPKGMIQTFLLPFLTHSCDSSEDTLLSTLTEDKGKTTSFPTFHFSWDVRRTRSQPCCLLLQDISSPPLYSATNTSTFIHNKPPYVRWPVVLKL